MKADRSLYAKEFINKAKEDIGVARTLLQEAEFFESSCFHSQQAAEKYLKAFLIKKGVRFKKIHDLEQLIEMCSG
jgi:HEPN domain-containing protein